ncbi:MAG TPA: phosphatidate cytidylyltransferase [Desulfobacteraceae bacterium]|nr:phosphatidate cytidylyltransferase [Desulfobacteraceae bacterium]HPJ68242.1 phosphatidate cytidylyltransferase [Desulfobacteraceae bacterium]HPQ29515.1 phosphatidate cytidylyltransferase [Desulfobacteraceae bacterium]
MHINRLLTGIIAIPALIYLIGPGPRPAFYSLLYIVTIIGLIEFYRMTVPGLPKFVRVAIYLLMLLLYVAVYLRLVLIAPVIILFCAFVTMTFFVMTHSSSGQEKTAEISTAVLGPIYIAVPLVMMIMIDFMPNGNIWIFFILVIIFANDTGGFYFGKLFGRHKLHEAVSPNKTWEGAIGGAVSSIITGFLFVYLMDFQKPDIKILLLVLVISVSGQIGDLAESMLKRNGGIKDSGYVLPGHGGILDRIDGLLFSIPILYLYLSFFIA